MHEFAWEGGRTRKRRSPGAQHEVRLEPGLSKAAIRYRIIRMAIGPGIITGQDCHAVADDPHAERARCKKLSDHLISG